ncbi:transporter substrate-binding domain-containing protein [Spirillospora sp. NPDC029432]|uniref:transporter substrate-binding domain-containing protein n=1 Tax=Spirillospora sp. NPDC029432 TaxID=3154599 RepID=UPI003453E67C
MGTRSRLRAALAAGTAALALAGCGVAEGADGSVADADSLVIGVKDNEPGLGSRGANGRYEGFDIDVARKVAEGLGVDAGNVTFKKVSSDQREDLLDEGAVDLVVASYSVTQQRKTEVTFAGPYYVAHQDILVRQSDAASVENVRDLAGKRLCRVDRSVSFTRVREERDVPVLSVPGADYADCVSKLAAGALDAVSTDDLILTGLAAKAAAAGSGPALRMVNAPISDEPYGIGLRKGDVEGCEAVNKAITGMYQDGTAAALLKKWFVPAGLEVTTTVPQFEGCD